MPIPINRNEWSQSSRNSWGSPYDERATEYENLGYRCRRCFAGCVFTDEEQQQTFEVEKKYVGWLPTLCPQCFREFDALREEQRIYQARWKVEKAALVNDRAFLLRWLEVLRAIPVYGKRTNSGMKVRILSCLEDAQCK